MFFGDFRVVWVLGCVIVPVLGVLLYFWVSLGLRWVWIECLLWRFWGSLGVLLCLGLVILVPGAALVTTWGDF